jgi:hypothetical protein
LGGWNIECKRKARVRIQNRRRFEGIVSLQITGQGELQSEKREIEDEGRESLP